MVGSLKLMVDVDNAVLHIQIFDSQTAEFCFCQVKSKKNYFLKRKHYPNLTPLRTLFNCTITFPLNLCWCFIHQKDCCQIDSFCIFYRCYSLIQENLVCSSANNCKAFLYQRTTWRFRHIPLLFHLKKTYMLSLIPEAGNIH